MKVLCTGDLHIGRRPTRLPAHVDSRPLSCAHAWSAIVDYAIDQQVDVVGLSGDVVDQANRFFEAVGPLERGLGRLSDAGIVTVAVAGNHDHDVLPQLARVLSPEAFRLLGRGGQWERTTVVGSNGARLHVDGWSFPAEHVRECPLDSYALSPDGDAPVLGLLHADLDAPGSRYAPVRLADLQSHSIGLWVLGHVHAHALHGGGGAPLVLYPGSPQAMDPGEAGVHGVWLVDMRPGGPIVPRHIPLASVRYETLDVDITGVSELSEMRHAVIDRLRAAVGELALDSGRLRHLSLRVRVVGSTPLHRHVERELAAMASDLDLPEGDVQVHVERVTAATRPVRDLEMLARGTDAVAVLAQLARDISADLPSPARDEILRGVEQMAGALRQAKGYRQIARRDDGLHTEEMRAVVEQQAMLLLDELLAQRELA